MKRGKNETPEFIPGRIVSRQACSFTVAAGSPEPSIHAELLYSCVVLSFLMRMSSGRAAAQPLQYVAASNVTLVAAYAFRAL